MYEYVGSGLIALNTKRGCPAKNGASRPDYTGSVVMDDNTIYRVGIWFKKGGEHTIKLSREGVACPRCGQIIEECPCSEEIPF